MSIPIGAAGLSFTNLTEIRDSAKNLMSLASMTGMDKKTESLSLSLLTKIDALSEGMDAVDCAGIERVFSELKQHLEEMDPELARLMVGNMATGGQALDRIVGELSAEGSEKVMGFEQKRSGAGAAAWLQIQHAQLLDTKRSGNADQMIQKIRGQMMNQSVADIDLEEAQLVLDEIKGLLVDGIQDMDEIGAIKKLLGSVPGLVVMFPSLLDNLKGALTEFLVTEIQDMSAEDARMFIREVVGELSEVLSSDLLSEDQIEEIVKEGAKPPAGMDVMHEEDSVDLSGDESAAPTIMAASIATTNRPLAINPLLMQGLSTAAGEAKSGHVPKTDAVQLGARGQHAKEPLERVRDILSALERLFADKLNTSGSVLENVLTRLQQRGGG